MTGATPGVADDPAIAVYLDDAIDTLWALDLVADWLDHASADAYDDLGDFCGHRTSIENLEDTIARQATNIRRAIAAVTREGAAIN
jgi:hypothetical protein